MFSQINILYKKTHTVNQTVRKVINNVINTVNVINMTITNNKIIINLLKNFINIIK